MITALKKMYRKEQFFPSYILGIWINPVFIVRRGLISGVKEISTFCQAGKLLDVGCGSKPYEGFFKVEEYIGIDIEVSGHDHASSKVDKFFDGKNIPFADKYFDHVFSSEVFEHVFNIDELLSETNRVLKTGGKLCFTCPFVWDEHEQPYDFARYTSFAVEHLLSKNGFKLIKLKKSTTYFETVMQMLSIYIYLHVLPRNNYIKLIMTPIFVAPINIFGKALSKVLPKSENFYHNNIVVAEKL
ncbi:class I SAM-dependent methyltransferase [Alphaproteobacteria bacterium]|nr:class I SAM-dependent methyltransferase [Alphaproteobacteria bacterium]